MSYSACNAGDAGSVPGLGRSPRGGSSNPLLFLPRKSNRLRSLAGYSQWGPRKSDTTEHMCSLFPGFVILWLCHLKSKSKLKVAQSCPILCDPMDYTVHGILQATILEWVAFPSPGDLPNPGIEPRCPALQADSLLAEPQGNNFFKS